MPRHASQQSDADEHREQTRSSVAHEWQRQAFIWDEAGGHGNVDAGLKNDDRRAAGGQEMAEAVTRAFHDVQTAKENAQIEQDDEAGAPQAGFLPDARENEIGLLFGHIAVFVK